jgi:pilus assembly protein Flp/PilA
MENFVQSLVGRFIKDESGLSAVEYGLLAAGIAIGLWTLISSMGASLHTIFSNVQADLSTAANGS